MSVELLHWNPQRPALKGRLGERFAPKRPLNNFGDLLGPLISHELLRRSGISAEAPDQPEVQGQTEGQAQADEARPATEERPQARLATVGSILHFCRSGDTIWGTGRNGKISDQRHRFSSLDVRAVRGPLTRDFLRGRGIDAPSLFGDPGILVGHLWDREHLAAGHRPRQHRIVPNFHDFREVRDRMSASTLDPRGDLWEVIGGIAASSLIVGSSLHGIIVAESLGIPARLVLPRTETLLKYEDYYRGTGRRNFTPAPDVRTALRWGGESLPDYDPEPLIDAFPRELWSH